MENIGLDIGAIIGAVAAFFKAVHSDRRASAIEDDRKTTIENLDVWKRETELKLEAHQKMLQDGSERFDKTDRRMDQINDKIDTVNSKVDRLIGMVSVAMGSKEMPR